MAEISTLTTPAEMRAAGNIDARTDPNVLQFYVSFAAMMLKEIIGDTNYASALAGTLPNYDNDKLRMAEALMAVGISFPAIANPTTQVGLARTTRVGVGGEIEVFSFSKEVVAMGTHFLKLGKNLIPIEYVQDAENFSEMWSKTVMRVFPGIDETPTVAPIASEVETYLKEARGDEDYSSRMG